MRKGEHDRKAQQLFLFPHRPEGSCIIPAGFGEMQRRFAWIFLLGSGEEQRIGLNSLPSLQPVKPPPHKQCLSTVCQAHTVTRGKKGTTTKSLPQRTAQPSVRTSLETHTLPHTAPKQLRGMGTVMGSVEGISGATARLCKPDGT